jgi:anti-anti-sigma regulatory factor
MLLELAPGWSMDLDRGPDWLFVRLRAPAKGLSPEFDMAEAVWEKLDQAFCYRLVMELDEVPRLQSWMIGQLVLLHKRIASNGGMMRLCGVSDSNQAALRSCRLDDRFPQYANRTAAVMGQRPSQPR